MPYTRVLQYIEYCLMVFVLVCLNHSGCHSVLISNLSHLHLGQEIGIGSLCVFIFWQWTNIDVEGIGNQCVKKLLQLQPPWNQHCRWFWKFSYALERGNGTSHIAFTQISLKPYCAIIVCYNDGYNMWRTPEAKLDDITGFCTLCFLNWVLGS